MIPDLLRVSRRSCGGTIYLADVLRKLAEGWAPERMDELTPDRWLDLYGDAADPAEP